MLSTHAGPLFERFSSNAVVDTTARFIQYIYSYYYIFIFSNIMYGYFSVLFFMECYCRYIEGIKEYINALLATYAIFSRKNLIDS